jgi:hypothetical protein
LFFRLSLAAKQHLFGALHAIARKTNEPNLKLTESDLELLWLALR